MGLSSSSLMHFTSSSKALKGILKEGFKIKYCKETWRLHKETQSLHIPMISFCDIPLSQIKNHIKSYGEYAIGLSKNWGEKMKLNPVLYIQSESRLAESYEILLENLSEFPVEADKDKEDKLTKIIDSSLDIARYIKNYEGVLSRGGKTSNYRFSDEREWRYVPDISEANSFYTVDEFSSVGKDVANSRYLDFRLDFEAKDIKYIIINNEDQISEFIDFLEKNRGHWPHKEVKKLCTRIFTAQQIETDV